ncbi:hypothetical protein ISP25_07385 [Rhodanobacter hydrolyticus]|uniref:Cyanophage baseplate Pam3 plug gp18 domain-containing protein n=2 Tax=Rhodanobacter hydrolyticus TaxID=2250595 RepID=A0ABW8J5N4_9GAMM
MLGGQVCQISLYQKSTGLFMDLTVNNVVLMTCVVCLNRTLMVRLSYLGFIGDLVFVDTQGADAPSYTGLGSRWLLFYLAPSDVTGAMA